MIGYPPEALPYDVGFLLFAVALFRYGAVLRRLTSILQRGRLDVLLTAGGALLMISVALHAYAYAAVLPRLDVSEAGAFEALYASALLLRHASLLCLVASGALTAASGLLYYRWVNR